MCMNDQGSDVVQRNATAFLTRLTHGQKTAMNSEMKSIGRNVDNAFHLHIVALYRDSTK